MPAIVSSILKYVFVVIIYLFIFGVIRLIYLDINSINRKGIGTKGHYPYIKLINIRENLGFKVEETYHIDRDIEIGRSNKNGIVINDPYISSRHARFIVRDGKYYIEDQGSTNGTLVNGMAAGRKEVCLNDGDKVHMGQLDFLFVDRPYV